MLRSGDWWMETDVRYYEPGRRDAELQTLTVNLGLFSSQNILPLTYTCLSPMRFVAYTGEFELVRLSFKTTGKLAYASGFYYPCNIWPTTPALFLALSRLLIAARKSRISPAPVVKNNVKWSEWGSVNGQQDRRVLHDRLIREPYTMDPSVAAHQASLAWSPPVSMALGAPLALLSSALPTWWSAGS